MFHDKATSGRRGNFVIPSVGVKYQGAGKLAEMFDISKATELTGALFGRIIFGGGSVDCLIRDLSEGGARIEIARACEFPPMFELEALGTKVRVWARRVWSSGNQTGLSFFEPCAAGRMEPLSGAKATTLQKIRELRDRTAQPAEVPIRS